MEKIEKVIRDRYRELAMRSSVFSQDFPYSFFQRSDNGKEHIEFDDSGKISIVATERGKEIFRDDSYEIEEFMYKIFKRKAENYGFGYEMRNRVEGKDFRRLAFGVALEKITEISPRWGQKLEREFNDILKEYPYDDED